MRGCLDPALAGELAAGSLSTAAAAPLEEHLDTCVECRRLVAELARAPDAAPPIHLGDVVAGRYRVVELAGAGAMGVVYRVTDSILGREVALKLVRPDRATCDGHSSGDDRLLREARAMAQLSHPNVVAVHDAGVDGGRVFLAMELARGPTLAAWLAERARSLAEIRDAFVAAGRGLAAAHAAGIVHRDFKPANVIVGDDGRIRVTDFGLALADAPVVAVGLDEAPIAVTATGAVLGTPAYMAPEQHRGEVAGPAADQFAFGVAMYEAACGAHPFGGGTARELAERVLAGRRAPAPGLPSPPRAMRGVLDRAMQLDPGARFPTMAELIAALEPRPARRRGIVAAAVIAVGLGAGVAAIAIAARRSAPTRPPAVTPTAATAAPTAPASPSPSVAVVPPDAVAAAPIAAAVPPDAAAPTSTAPTGKTRGASAPLPEVARFGALKTAVAEGSLATLCFWPVDPASPAKRLRHPIADWGRVVRRAAVIGRYGGRDFPLDLYEVAGQRRSYVFDGGTRRALVGVLDAAPGTLVMVCPMEDENLYTLPAAWAGATTKMEGYAAIAAPPLIATRAKLAALHVSASDLSHIHAAADWTYDTPVAVYTQTQASPDGTRVDLGGWFLDVPDAAMRARLVPEHSVWIVADHPSFVDSGGKEPTLVVDALAVEKSFLRAP